MQSLTAKDTKDAKEYKSLTTKDTKDTKEYKNLTTKDAKDTKQTSRNSNSKQGEIPISIGFCFYRRCSLRVLRGKAFELRLPSRP